MKHQKKNLVAIIFMILITGDAFSQGVIDKDINGPRYTCVNVPVNYTTGPALCESNYWKVTYEGNPVLDHRPASSCTVAATYFLYNQSIIDVRSTPSALCDAQRWFNIYQTLPITFKLPGKYTVTAIPRGRIEDSQGSFCQDETITVYVGSASITSSALNGSTQLSNCALTASYSVADAGNVEYQWSMSSSLRPQSALITTASPNVTFSLNAFSVVGNICGSLTLTTISKCGEPNQTKSWNICRGVTANISGSISGQKIIDCNKSGKYTLSISPVAGAIGYSWYISPTDITSLKISSYQTSTTTPYCDVTYNTSLGSSSGSIVVKANFPCGGVSPNMIGTTLNRNDLQAKILGLQRTGIVCLNRPYTLSASDGIPSSWIVKQYSSGGLISSTTFNTPTARFTISDSRVNGVAWDLNYSNVCSGASYLIGGGAGVYPANSSYCITPTTATVSTLHQKVENSTIAVYPNPVNDFLHITVPESVGSFSVKILDALNGTLMEEKSDKSEFKLDIRNLQTGVYYVHIIENQKNVYTKRIVVKR
jgi:hypothetical protein